MSLIKFGDGSQWQCLGGQWTGDDAGAVSPPNENNLHSRAFYTAKAYGDFVAEFEYNPSYRDGGQGDAGLVLRAADGGHFYFVHFPWGAQSLRAKNYWGGIAKVSGDGYLRNMAYENVRGIPSEVERWFKVKVEAQGPRISVWVDGRKAFEAHDNTYKSGFIGFAGHGWYAFRNLNITGTEIDPPQWDQSVRIAKPGFELPVDSQEMPSACIAPNGDVLIGSGTSLLRSSDKGKTWTTETFPDFIGVVSDYGNTMFCDAKGRLFIQLWQMCSQTGQSTPACQISESADNGKTWSHPVASVIEAGWPEDPANLTPYGPLVETADGTLLRFMLGGVDQTKRPWRDIFTWPALGYKGFCTRSTDGGKTWSAPIDLDWPTWTGKTRGEFPGCLDFTEPTGVAIGNTVTVVSRPVYSREMWQCWSHDAGKTWDAAVRTTFPGYAQSMVRTRSGTILVAHRNPNHSVNVSRDNGLNWDAGTVIDYPAWAMGCALEVEPDVVLITYMNNARSGPLLAQRIAVTAETIEPLN
jgi:hypothetical protein